MVTNSVTKEKLGIGFQSLFPVLSIVDPELMVSVPPKLTAYQGLDTFFHLAEGYLSKKANPFNEMGFRLQASKRSALIWVVP